MTGREYIDMCSVSVPLRGKGRDQPQQEAERRARLEAEVSVPLRGKGRDQQEPFPGAVACHPVSVPLRGKGRDQPKSKGQLCPAGVVSVPLRGKGRDQLREISHVPNPVRKVSFRPLAGKR